MATPISHAVAALGIGACFYTPRVPKRVWAIGALCSVVPDLDGVGFRFGVRHGDFWGHRGFSHSIIFAALLAAVAVGISFRRALPSISRLSLWMYFFLATASHGLLDAMTDGGLGVAFFSPVEKRRYFLPWTPIPVAPISITDFFTLRGLAVIEAELFWIWIPAGLLAAAAWTVRRRDFAESVRLLWD